MLLPKREELIEEYLSYTDKILEAIIQNVGELPDDIGIKQKHGLSMMDAVASATKKSGMFNESYDDSAAIEGLLHDIGRFEQYKLSGTLKDKESEEFTLSKDHGQFGKKILLQDDSSLLRRFIPVKSNYDLILTEVIGEHTTTQNTNYKKSILELKDAFRNYSLDEILNSNNIDIKHKLIALKLMILKEQDSLELLQNIISGAWKPNLSNDKEEYVAKEIIDLFINCERMDMAKLKEKGVWSINAGALLRLGLIPRNVNFVGTLKEIKDNNWIDKINEKSINRVLETSNSTMDDPALIFAPEYMKILVDNLIATSPDGIILTEKSKKEAIEETKKAIK